MKAMVRTDAAGHHGDGNSDAGRPFRAISRFIATWEARIMTHTHTVAKVAIEAISRNTSSGITAFSTTPTSRMPAIITTVIHGTPWRETLPKLAGAWPWPGQPEEDPAGAEDVAVDGGQRGGDHHGVEDVRRRRECPGR